MRNPFLPTVAALAVLVPATVAQSLNLEPIWSVAAGSQPYLGGAGSNTERGMAYNPVTGNLLLVSRNGGLSVNVLDNSNGSRIRTLDTTGITGGTFALNQVGVAADGAIYAANLVTDANASAYKVYRWASDSDPGAPTLVYSGNPAGAGVTTRVGDNLRVNGFGALTQIIAGVGTSGAFTKGFIHLGTSDGLSYAATPISVPDLTGGDTRLGIAFGPGSTVFAKQQGDLRWITYDAGAGTGTLDGSFTLVSGAGTAGPFDRSPDGNSLVALTFSSTAGAEQRVNLYGPLAAGSNNPIDFEPLGSFNANANASGSVQFNTAGDVVYVLASNNGLYAYAVVPEPTTYALIAGLGLTAFAAYRRQTRKA